MQPEFDSISFCNNHINLLFEGLQPLRSAVRAGNSSLADAELWHVWRERLNQFPQNTPNGDLTAADHLLNNKLSLLNSDLFELGEPVNWHRFSEDHPQMTSHLAYMYWLVPLAKAYRQTRDERYSEKFLQIIESFLSDLPYGDDSLPWYPVRAPILDEKRTCNNGETSARAGQWISLACHARIDAWLQGLANIRESNALTLRRLARILLSLMSEHARLIVGNPRENTPNQYFATSVSLLRLAVSFPEFNVAESYFHIAWARLQHCIEVFVLPDGAMVERSLNYNKSFLEQLSSVQSLLANAPAARKVGMLRVARRCALVLSRLTTPDGRQLPVAKTHPVSLRKQMASWGDQFKETECLRLSRPDSSATGVAPLSFYLPFGGYTILRESWSEGSFQIFFKSSGPSPGHMHEDCLHVGLSGHGRDMLVEAGNFNYNDTTELDRAMAEYCNSTRGHNGVLVDGFGQSRINRRLSLSGRQLHERINWDFFRQRLRDRSYEGQCFAMTEGSYLDGFGSADGTIRVSHLRTIVWIRSLGVVVIDRLSPEDDGLHTYETCWHLDSHFNPELARWDARKHQFSIQSAEDQLRFSVNAPGEVVFRKHFGSDNPCRGWQCLEYGKRIPKLDIEFRTEGDGTHTLLTLIELVSNSTPAEPYSCLPRSQGADLWTTGFGRNGDRITAHFRNDGDLLLEVEDASFGKGSIQIPGDRAKPPLGKRNGVNCVLTSLAVDENPRLRQYFDVQYRQGVSEPPA